MSEYIDNQLIENTYLFCVRRIADSEEAKDLAQDILLEALRVIASGKEFFNFYSWYWRMAHNKYANYIAHKKNRMLPLEVAGGIVENSSQPIDKIIDDEQISYLNYSLSRLASYQREMIIRFYLKEQSIKQISDELQIPIGTVKRRLFDAKKTVKERFEHMKNIGISSYAPAEVDWFWGYSCREASEVLDNNKIAQQVCVLCGAKSKSMNEIADEMGVAPIYLEPILEQMINTKLLVSTAKKQYLTNFCVFPKQAYMNATAVSCIEFRKNGYCEKISKMLYELKEKITKLNFYGNDFGYDYLMWILYVITGDQMGILANEKYLEKYKGKYEDEAEREYRITMQYIPAEEEVDDSLWNKEVKTTGWSNLHNILMTSHYGKLEYVNDYENDPFPVEDESFQSGRDLWVNGNNISLLLDLTENKNKPLNLYEEEMVAEFIKNGLVKKTEDGLKVLLPIFKREIFLEICEIVKEAIGDFAFEFSEIVSDKVENLLLPYVRKDLMSNFIYWDMRMFFQPITYLFYYGMYESDYLAIPEDYARSAAGLYILRE